VRIGLADVKKRVVPRQGEAYLVPHLLRRGELRAEIGALIALYEEWLGREQSEFPAERAAELIGDYRLARSLTTTLTEYYDWSAPAWPGPASAVEAHSLAVRGIATPGHLRLALYDMVNARHGGYLSTAEREPALDAFAAELGLSRSTLDALLTLDAAECTRLGRAAPTAPTAEDLSALYNQRAVEVLLANAAVVEWVVLPEFAARLGASLGTILKRICFLARRMGVYYDVAFAEGDGEDARTLEGVAEASASYTTALPDGLDRPLCITLYGPQEAFGAPNQYGDRLARLCRALLGYSRQPATGEVGERSRGMRRPLQGAGVGGLRGEAQIYLRGRSFRFALDERLLALLGGRDLGAAEESMALPALVPDVAFDSELERSLYVGFAALERADATHGWRIEREPEPILCGTTILIPDFALTRGGQRVYLEVVGYWSPSYRERKRRKLTALAGRVALALAVPEQARADLESLSETFPTLWFKDQVSPQALLNLLQARYDDFATRRALVPHEPVLAEVEQRGLLPWNDCVAALHAYGRTEVEAVAADLAATARRLRREPPALVDGVGLATLGWLTRAGGALAAWVEDAGEAGLTLGDLTERMAELAPGLAARPEAPAMAEALAWATGYTVVRESLFEPRVVTAAAVLERLERSPDRAQAKPGPRARPAAPHTQPRRPPRRSKDREETPSQSQLLPWDTPAE
jgi:predicted nuclease of restriction endonuclease-like RecB superfamily